MSPLNSEKCECLPTLEQCDRQSKESDLLSGIFKSNVLVQFLWNFMHLRSRITSSKLDHVQNSCFHEEYEYVFGQESYPEVPSSIAYRITTQAKTVFNRPYKLINLPVKIHNYFSGFSQQIGRKSFSSHNTGSYFGNGLCFVCFAKLY